MKRTSLHLALIAAAILWTVGSVPAQPLITTSIERMYPLRGDPGGSDIWLVEMENQWGINEGGQYMRLYITAPNNITAYVGFEGQTTPVPITAYRITSFLIPNYWQMESSGIPEYKGIHVWSDGSQLTVYNMNHNAYTGDGEYVIPTTGWGWDYVVAAYHSWSDFEFSAFDDEPSTCAIVASQDSTLVSITPSCDCRQDSNDGHGSSIMIEYPADSTFTIQLNRSESFQLMPIKSDGSGTDDDLTGTIIHASNPIGVFGGSDQPDIPKGFPYGDHVEEMIPPILSWGKTYYATSFVQLSDTIPSTHDSAMYLFVSSKPNQTIVRSGCGSAVDTVCTIQKQFGIFWAEEFKAVTFTSSEPFMCVEYSNSCTYPDQNCGSGDPSEVILTPQGQFLKSVPFYAQNSFQNFANITVNKNDIAKTKLDSIPLSQFKNVQCLDSNWEMVVDSVTGTFHQILGDDSGVSVTVYGYGYDETYSWSSTGSTTELFNSSDTLPPIAIVTPDCYGASIHVSDSGIIFGDTQSGIDAFFVDSDYNMTFGQPTNDDGTLFIEGSSVPGANYHLAVNDITKPAILIIVVSDMVGNEIKITSTYTPAFDTIVPPLQDLGVQIAPAPQNIAYDTIYNTGEAPITIDIISLKYRNKGFVLYDSTGGELNLPITLQPGNRYLIEIQFVSPPGITGASFDSIIVSTSCNTQEVALVGSDGANDFTVTNQTWINDIVPTPANGYQKTVTIANLSEDTIVIDSASWTDTAHFKQALNTNNIPITPFPIMITPNAGKRGGTATFMFAYFPDANSARVPDTAIVTWYSHNVLISGTTNPSPRFDMLIGDAISSDVAFSTIPTSPIVRSIDGELIQVTLPSNWLNTNLEIYTMLGQRVYVGMLPNSTTLDLGSLPRGVYFWRLKSNGESQAGKILLGE